MRKKHLKIIFIKCIFLATIPNLLSLNLTVYLLAKTINLF